MIFSYEKCYRALLSLVLSSFVLKYYEPEIKQVWGEKCLTDENLMRLANASFIPGH
jgi:hypothetical protein